MLRDTIPGRQISQRFIQDSNGILTFFDQTRGRYLSVFRNTFKFGLGHKGIYVPRWLEKSVGINTFVKGHDIIRNGVITCLSASSSTVAENCVFRVRTNISGPDITTISLVNKDEFTIDNLNINVNKKDDISVLLDVISGKVDNPELIIEIAWR